MEVVAGITLEGVGGGVVLVVAFILWVLGHAQDEPPHPDDPNTPAEDGFIPADKYGYGYGYSWGDPYGDPDL